MESGVVVWFDEFWYSMPYITRVGCVFAVPCLAVQSGEPLEVE